MTRSWLSSDIYIRLHGCEECKEEKDLNCYLAPIQERRNSCKRLCRIARQDRRKLTRKEFHRIVFQNCSDCTAMAAIPQGAFAVNKVRQVHELGNCSLSRTEKGQNANESGSSSGFNGTKFPEGWDLMPLQYNSKLMNSIWGLYNRYSVHNFKKNTDPNEENPLWAAFQGKLFPEKGRKNSPDALKPAFLGSGATH